MKKTTARRLLIMVLIIISLSSIITLPVAFKVIRTDVKLFVLSVKISCIEDDANKSKPGYGWTTERIRAYNALQAERKALCNSDDRVVSIVANSNNAVRLLQLILIAFVSYVQFNSCKLVVLFCKKKFQQKKR